MKKLTAVLLLLAVLLCLAGCSGEENHPDLKGTPAELIEKLYGWHQEIELPLVTTDLDLTDAGALEYNLGMTSAEPFSAVSLSEPLMGQPYSLILARVKDAADAEKTAKGLLDSVDTRKWICMEADTKMAAYYGDVVLFFMVSSEFSDSATTDSIAEAFQKLCGGNATVIA